MNKLVSTLHDATHQVPGVPAHREDQRPDDPHPRLGNRRPHLQSGDRHHQTPRQHQTPQHHQSPPRVLIAWQNWIGRLVGHGDHR